MKRRRLPSGTPSATIWLAALVLTTLLLAGALRAPEPAAAQGTGQTVAVEMGERGNEYFFTPKEITVPAGTVRFTFHNAGTRRHNFVVEAVNQRIPDLNAGANTETTFTFATPGTYTYICDLPTHASRGMTGSLIVGPAGAAAGAAAPTTVGPTAPALQTTAQAPAGASPVATTVTGAGSTTGTPAPAPSPRPAPAAQSQAGPSPTGIPLFVSLAIHIPAAITWLGIVLYQAVVSTVPFLTVTQRADLLRRPRWLILVAIPLFSVTGIYQSIYNPFMTITDFQTLEEFRATTTYGLALFLKHGFVMASVALTLVVTFWLAPRLAAGTTTVAVAGVAGTTTVDQPPPAVAERTGLLAAANVAACLALLLCVAVMVFQLH